MLTIRSKYSLEIHRKLRKIQKIEKEEVSIRFIYRDNERILELCTFVGGKEIFRTDEDLNDKLDVIIDFLKY